MVDLTQDITRALIGGGMIGLAAVMLMGGVGRIMGISGIVAGLLPAGDARQGDSHWRLVFLLGVLAAPIVFLLITGASPKVEAEAGVPLMAIGGFLVGVGTIIGNGCTSGHGVCGLARLSRRSFVATLIFMATAVATVFVARHVVGG